MKKLIGFLILFAVMIAFATPVLATEQPKVIKLENRVSVKPPVPQGTILDYCGLAKTNGTGSSITSFLPGWQNVTYFDPATCPGVPTYPFEITTFYFTLYDYYGSSPWPYPVDVVVYDMLQPGDPCLGPGAELCRFTVICDQASFEFPNAGMAIFPQACCVNGPFFIGLEFTDPNPSPPSPVWDDQIPPCCDNWFFFPSTWQDWCTTFGDPPTSGYPLFWVDGETPPNNCVGDDWSNHKMHYPQLPDPNGWDVNATEPFCLADDWQCSESGYIQDLHWWGSWRHDEIGQILGFIVTIHSNNPVGPGGYSIPSDPLWGPFIIDEFATIPVDPPSPQGWYDPASGEVFPQGDHQQYFRYDVLLPEAQWLWQNQGEIYWLRVSAIVADPEFTKWGWKSTQDHFMDDAVWAPDPFDPLPPWTEIYEPGGGPPPEPIVNGFFVGFDMTGGFIYGGGDDPYPGGEQGSGWYFYEFSEWWNIWFYDHPLDFTRKKEIFVDGFLSPVEPGAPAYIEIAINWSTDQWEPGGPPPIPDLFPPEMEEIFIGREQIFFFDGPFIDPIPVQGFFELLEYNPEWVSMDVRGYNFFFDGVIEHTCMPRDPTGQSLDLSFVITGGEPIEMGACCWEDGSCTQETESNCVDNGGTFMGYVDCSEVECPVEDPVYDLWETPEGFNTFVDFGCGPNIPAIPAGFFGPGSDPFDGTIALQGEPLATTGDLGPTDTIIKRSRAANLPQCPSTDQVEIEIVALNLVSVEPIIVTYEGGNPEPWNVKVCLSEFDPPQPSGSMTINQVCTEGGTFSAYLPVSPKVIFRRISDGFELYIDFAEWGLADIDLSVEYGHWTFFDPGFGVYTSSGTELVSNCDDNPDIPIGPSGVDLFPGIQTLPCEDCSGPSEDHDIPITTLIEPYNCVQHDVWPPHDIIANIPTMSEWGMLLLALLLMAAGTVAIVRRRKEVAARG